MDDTAVANLAMAILTEGAITSLTQDKHAARVLNRQYIPTRRAEIAKKSWNFAIRSRSMEGADLEPTQSGTLRYRYPAPWGGDDLTDLITNGAMAADTAWTKGTGWSIAAGVASKAAGVQSDLEQNVAVEEKLGYRIEYTLSAVTAGVIEAEFQNSSGTVLAQTASRNADGDVVDYLRAPNGTTGFALRAGSTFAGSVDGVKLTPLTKMLRVLPLTYNGEPHDVQISWRQEGDYILSDLSGPRTIRFLTDVPDPDDWHPLFVDVMAGALAVKTAWSITGKLDAIKVAQNAYDRAVREAALGNALERGGRLNATSFATARGDTRGWPR